LIMKDIEKSEDFQSRLDVITFVKGNLLLEAICDMIGHSFDKMYPLRENNKISAQKFH